MKFNWKRNALIYIVIVVMVILLISMFRPGGSEPEKKTLSEVITMSQNGQIEKLVVDGEELRVTTVDNKELKTDIGSLNMVDLKELGLVVPEGGFEIKSPSGINWGSLLINFLPFLLLIFIFFMIFRQARGANNQAMSV